MKVSTLTLAMLVIGAMAQVTHADLWQSDGTGGDTRIGSPHHLHDGLLIERLERSWQGGLGETAHVGSPVVVLAVPSQPHLRSAADRAKESLVSQRPSASVTGLVSGQELAQVAGKVSAGPGDVGFESGTTSAKSGFGLQLQSKLDLGPQTDVPMYNNPAPGALLLGAIGVGFAAWMKRRFS